MLSSIINGLQQLNTSDRSITFTFQKGKIFFATVKNIYPNNFALLQIGNQNLIAKLEVALKNGEAYWFQVDSDEGDIQLKLLSDKQQSGNEPSIILKQLSLPSTKANIDLVQFLSKEQIPFTKETVLKMSGMLSNSTDNKENLNIIKQMVAKGLTISESIFKSLYATENKEPIQNQIQLLELSLSNEEQTPIVKEMQSAIDTIKNIQNKQLATSLIQTLKDDTVSKTNDMQLISKSVLQKLGKELEDLSLYTKTKNSTNLIQNQNEFLTEKTAFISNPSISQKIVNNTVKVIEHYFSKEVPPENMLFTQQEKDYLTDILNTMKQTLNGKDVVKQFKEVTKSLGLFYEYQIAGNPAEHHVEEQLKPLLVKFLQESGHSQEVREIADSLVNKMNGQQIQMYDSSPIQHLFYEIPIQLFGFKTNLTMQWSGKKKEDGKIDPNYCHILFYLNLEHLHETIVEMKVQNRVINVNVYSESNVKEAAANIIPKLKNNLEELNYQLSAIHFMEIQSEKTTHIKKNTRNVNQAYNGVDLKI
ncbi:hypothetical protein AN964_14830 [Heyndrickxia shackletonii]|uniref:Flagellar hook-length control protein-like C-terminal domain-containing protein n=1 Tax=Heyndrickxia shackletonii TaxID=157838 RepID=A0A0Q3TKW9_9BACI|nr:hypothetical protein [Heyndrickxia shackletonii]KQL54646.1 hypothetical protein AN964_14830 [Heyndrickxia shackletonii]NEY98296.1 hypothetical protein [Heyndrickxia shackletonii]